jgi:molybdopterin-guanine dinucleotide biosynthesis protein B
VNRIHIVGRKNSGKTTLVVDLVQALREQGLRVGTVKHTHHQHRLDTPGKDSYRHGAAGAAVVGILTPDVSAVFRTQDTTDDEPTDRYEAMAPMFADCDLVLVEGDAQTSAPTIEVWRADVTEAPLAMVDANILAIVSDDQVPADHVQIDRPIWPRSDIRAIAANVRKTLDL